MIPSLREPLPDTGTLVAIAQWARALVGADLTVQDRGDLQAMTVVCLAYLAMAVEGTRD